MRGESMKLQGVGEGGGVSVLAWRNAGTRAAAGANVFHQLLIKREEVQIRGRGYHSGYQAGHDPIDSSSTVTQGTDNV